jgi:hypothetical protein
MEKLIKEFRGRRPEKRFRGGDHHFMDEEIFVFFLAIETSYRYGVINELTFVSHSWSTGRFILYFYLQSNLLLP